jgi:DNA-3-methyladenine glycosylase II
MNQNDVFQKLDQKSLEEGVFYLCKIDSNLREVIKNYGNPPLWDREPGFSTLLHIILEQQVSVASANAAFAKLSKAANQLTPDRFLEFSDSDLKIFGFSRQKTRYGRELAAAILTGKLDLVRLEKLDNADVRKQLIAIKGIGLWTADIYLMEALLRPDIWPTGDLALAKALQKLKDLPEIPSTEQQRDISEKWKPWRAVAARIAWHYYLNSPRRT